MHQRLAFIDPRPRTRQKVGGNLTERSGRDAALRERGLEHDIVERHEDRTGRARVGGTEIEVFLTIAGQSTHTSSRRAGAVVPLQVLALVPSLDKEPLVGLTPVHGLVVNGRLAEPTWQQHIALPL